MQLTKQSEYALQGLAFLAAADPERAIPLAEIAEAQHLPASFLAKIFQKLVRHGIL
ncbi:MAG: Rrf2 family transcriptional regulator, partial [Gemmatimonadetes bacterium]|nr:Rrf2 family transcriptional regulator [Gemmatimonadota bacterium]